MVLIIYFLVLVSLSVKLSAAQGTVTLNKQGVEKLMQLLSPNCRNALELAMGSEAELGDDCKDEIQSILSADVNNNAEPSSATTKSSEKTPQTFASSNPVAVIAGVGAMVLGAVAAIIVYLNSLRSTNDSTKRQKKISKKKEEKLRLKGQR